MLVKTIMFLAMIMLANCGNQNSIFSSEEKEEIKTIANNENIKKCKEKYKVKYLITSNELYTKITLEYKNYFHQVIFEVVKIPFIYVFEADSGDTAYMKIYCSTKDNSYSDFKAEIYIDNNLKFETDSIRIDKKIIVGEL